MKELDYEVILSMDLEQLYGHLRILEIEEQYDVSDVIEKVRYGIKLKFDVFNYTRKMSSIVLKEKLGIALIMGKQYNLSDFFTEIEDRKAIARKRILEINETKNRITPRV